MAAGIAKDRKQWGQSNGDSPDFMPYAVKHPKDHGV